MSMVSRPVEAKVDEASLSDQAAKHILKCAASAAKTAIMRTDMHGTKTKQRAVPTVGNVTNMVGQVRRRSPKVKGSIRIVRALC